jgi:hypothetical protein
MDLGDERLKKRARILMERLSAKSTAGIPLACNGRAATMGAYRFFANNEVEWADILAPCLAQTHQRMKAHPVVLCLEDTMELDFNGQQIEEPGPLNYEARRGMNLHLTYVVTPQREPLSVTDA